MRVARRWLAAAVVLAGLAACGGGGGAASGSEASAGPVGLEVVQASVMDRHEPKIKDARDVEAVGDATAAFALDLYRRVAAGRAGNVLVGPYSAWLALTMTSVGAAGVTSEELTKALRHPLDEARLLPAVNAMDRLLAHRADDEQVTLNVANRLWGQRGMTFKPEFLDALTEHFGAPLVAADFAGDPDAARKAINAWVSERTEQKIPELFAAGSIDSSTALTLVNAVYLDAPWEFPFDSSATSISTFIRADGSEVETPFMYYGEYLPTHVSDDLAVVELPYAGSSLSMVVMMPRGNFRVFEKGLDKAALDRILGKIEDGGIHLSMPKFSFSTHTSLIPALKAMGVRAAFGGADFSRMSDAGLVIGAVEHEAFIDVDEKGTEAAAATGVSMDASHGPDINVNRPFLFLIRDRSTNATLFVGRVLDPTAK